MSRHIINKIIITIGKIINNIISIEGVLKMNIIWLYYYRKYKKSFVTLDITTKDIIDFSIRLILTCIFITTYSFDVKFKKYITHLKIKDIFELLIDFKKNQNSYKS